MIRPVRYILLAVTVTAAIRTARTGARMLVGAREVPTAGVAVWQE
jgi:hypothetical protein